MKYNVVALGGTFDIIHIGHITLIEKAASISEKVIIGLTSDSYIQKTGKNIQNDYKIRYENLSKIIHEEFPNTTFEIVELNDDFGPAVSEGSVDALVASEETANKITTLNTMRIKSLNLKPIELVIVPMKLASDGDRISSTRIRNSEIDIQGNIC